MISFLKDEEKQDKTGLSDLILFLVIIGLGVGGYFYFNFAESDTMEEYIAAEKLFVDKQFEEAYHAYNDLMNASWNTDSLDKVIYRNGQILDIIMFPPEDFNPIDSLNAQWEAFTLIQAEFNKDTLNFITNFVKPEQTSFLRYDQYHEIEQWEQEHATLITQKKYFLNNKSLWEKQSTTWSQSDSTKFLNGLDSIGTAAYLAKSEIDIIKIWKNFKDSLVLTEE